MKRYLLFASQCFYSDGGWDDFKGSFDRVEDACAACVPEMFNLIEFDEYSDLWRHIVDTETWQVVREVMLGTGEWREQKSNV